MKENGSMFIEKFNALANACEVSDEEKALAQFFWYAGLRHAFQRGTSQPALLKAKAKVNSVKSNVSPRLLAKAEDTRLTAYEANILSLFLKDVLNFTNQRNLEYKVLIESLWSDCDKNDPSTINSFVALNKTKAHANKIKSQAKVLADAQRKLKKIMKDV